MLSVAVHKDVAEYEPKIIGKLTGRTLICIAGALGISVLAGLYMQFVLGINVSDNIMVVYAISLPFWACGFIRPKGLKFEEFAVLWLNHQLTDNRIFYTPSMMKLGYVRDTKERGKKVYDKYYRKLVGTRGVEAYSPSAGRVL